MHGVFFIVLVQEHAVCAQSSETTQTGLCDFSRGRALSVLTDNARPRLRSPSGSHVNMAQWWAWSCT